MHSLITRLRTPGGEILGFLAFSHGWTFAWWALAALLAWRAGTSIWSGPAVVAFYIGGAGVFLGGLVMTAVRLGVPGFRSLARRCIDLRPIRAPLWAAILLFYPVLTIMAAAMAGLPWLDFDATLEVGPARERLAEPLALLGFLGFILLIGPLPEEVGWRGFLLDRLLTHTGALVATLVVVVAWWSWHLPLPHLPGYYDAFVRDPPGPLRALVGMVPDAILVTWLFIATSRSVLAAILFHFMGNLTGQMLLPSDDVRLIRLIMEYGAAALVLGCWPAGKDWPRLFTMRRRFRSLE